MGLHSAQSPKQQKQVTVLVKYTSELHNQDNKKKKFKCYIMEVKYTSFWTCSSVENLNKLKGLNMQSQ